MNKVLSKILANTSKTNLGTNKKGLYLHIV